MSLIETVLGSLPGLGLVTNFVIAAEGELDADSPTLQIGKVCMLTGSKSFALSLSRFFTELIFYGVHDEECSWTSICQSSAEVVQPLRG